MELTPYANCVPSFIEEYKELVDCLPFNADDDQLRRALIQDSEWSERGSKTLVLLARQYGSFVLSNALTLAEALGIEDGESGL